MKRAIALAFLCLFSASLSACSRTHSWTVPGVLRVAARQDPDNLNMLLGTQTIDSDLSMFFAGYLFNLNDRDELEPELATRVPTQSNGDISPDGRTVTYHLRRGVSWHDGVPFTADDVIFTWHAMLNPQNLAVSRFGYDIVSSIDERDPYTIVVHLKRRFSPFVATFFTMANHPDFILPKHLLAKYPNINHAPYNEMPVGTGPFRVASYAKGSKIVFVANDRYWRGAPKLKRVEWSIIGSDNTILTLLRSHQIDMFYRAPETMAESLRNIPGTRVSLSPFTRFADIGLNGSVPQLRDVRVRQALAYATDKKALIEKVTHGIDVQGETDQPSFFWAYNPNVLHYAYDLPKAKALLDEAGWREGEDGIRRKDSERFELTLVSFSGSGTATAVEELLQAQWRQAGVDVTIKNYPSGQLYATAGMGGIEQSGKFDASFENWANGSDPDESILVTCAMAPPAGWNIYHLCDAQLDAAEKTALTSYDREIRRNAYFTVQRILNERVPFIVLWYQRQFDVVNTDLKNYRPAHAVTPFWNTWQWSI